MLTNITFERGTVASTLTSSSSALLMNSTTTARISHCTFRDNRGPNAPAVYVANGVFTVEFDDVEFSGNSAGDTPTIGYSSPSAGLVVCF
jgi:hypothetical protein